MPASTGGSNRGLDRLPVLSQRQDIDGGCGKCNHAEEIMLASLDKLRKQLARHRTLRFRGFGSQVLAGEILVHAAAAIQQQGNVGAGSDPIHPLFTQVGS